MEMTGSALFTNSITVLQWGHNFFVMEISPSATEIKSSGESLQWGHNFFVMEIPHTICARAISQKSFNGAITFSLWKLQQRRK